MEIKTTVEAEKGQSDLRIRREFDLPVGLLWRAHTEAAIVEEWMSHAYSTLHFVTMDCRRHGAWEFERRDPQGQVHMRAHGVYHTVHVQEKIVRTFEMLDAGFGVLLEVYEFEPMGEGRSLLRLHMLFESAEFRDAMLEKGMVSGLGMAHNRLEEIVGKK